MLNHKPDAKLKIFFNCDETAPINNTLVMYIARLIAISFGFPNRMNKK